MSSKQQVIDQLSKERDTLHTQLRYWKSRFVSQTRAVNRKQASIRELRKGLEILNRDISARDDITNELRVRLKIAQEDSSRVEELQEELKVLRMAL